jgi:hypothetical protein
MDDVILRAVHMLTRGGQWDEALALLAAVQDDASRHRARAEVLGDRSFWSGDLAGTRASDAAMAEIEGDDAWSARMLRARAEYGRQLQVRLSGGQPETTALDAALPGLAEDAPDPVRAAQAHFYLGLTADHLRRDPETASRHYAVVIDAGDPP